MGFFTDESGEPKGLNITLIIVIPILVLIALGMMGCPKYNVWQKALAGEAQLKQAEWNRQIKIKEAEAEEKSAGLLGRANITKAEYAAKAEVARAKGVAEANKIIGSSLKGNNEYLKYLWIQGLQDGSSEVIYVPTEATIPILEAGKRLAK